MVRYFWVSVLLGSLATGIASRVVAALYRMRVRELMGQNPGPASTRTDPPLSSERARQVPPGSALQNFRARQQLRRFVAFSSVLIGTSAAALQGATWLLADAEAFDDATGSPAPSSGVASTILILVFFALLNSWVVVPALGIVERWSALRTILLTLAYLGAVVLLLWLSSLGHFGLSWSGVFLLSPIQFLACFILIGNRRFRSVGPYMLPICVTGTWALAGSLDWLANAVVRLSPSGSWQTVNYLRGLAAVTTIIIVALLAILAATLSWLLVRTLGRAYRLGAFSDLLYMVGLYWLIVLGNAATLVGSWLPLLALACLPLLLLACRRRLLPAADPPILLVLRVYRDEAATSSLFDLVVDRWRHTGLVYLLAGPDLALRTLDPERLFAYIDRRLGRYLITGEEALERRLAEVRTAADHDGRFRLYEFLCLAGAWQATYARLLNRANCVLMDLRGLRASNLGSLYELRKLGQATHLQRAVLIIDERTDLAAAYEQFDTHPPWIEWHVRPVDRRGADALLEALLQPPSSQQSLWPTPRSVPPSFRGDALEAPTRSPLPPPAPMALRFLSRVLDWLSVLGAGATVFGLIALLHSPVATPDPRAIDWRFTAVCTAVIGPLLLSQIAQLRYWGATVGMLIAGLRLASLPDGNRPSWRQAGIRFGSQVLAWCTCGAGSVLLALSPALDRPDRRQGWHDRAATSAVVRNIHDVPHAADPADVLEQWTPPPPSQVDVDSIRSTPSLSRPRPASAPLAVRLLGRILDWIVVLVVASILMSIPEAIDPEHFPSDERAGVSTESQVLFMALIGVCLVTQVAQLRLWGATIGMLLTGSRVVSLLPYGSRPSWRQAGIRFGFQVLGWCTCGVGSIVLGCSPLFDPLPGRRQGSLDRAANTLVVRRAKRRRRTADPHVAVGAGGGTEHASPRGDVVP